MGCVLSRLRHDFLRTVNKPLSRLGGATLAHICAEHVATGRMLLRDEGAAPDAIETGLGADMCYAGQSNVISVAFSEEEAGSWDGVRRAFERAYAERYGRLLDGVDAVLVNTRVTVSSRAGLSTLSEMISLPAGGAPQPRHTEIFFGGRWIAAKLLDRHALPAGSVTEGPALLLQADSTTFVEPGYRATVHPTGNILLEACR
jgi:N-methylhydantoinase A